MSEKILGRALSPSRFYLVLLPIAGESAASDRASSRVYSCCAPFSRGERTSLSQRDLCVREREKKNLVVRESIIFLSFSLFFSLHFLGESSEASESLLQSNEWEIRLTSFNVGER